MSEIRILKKYPVIFTKDSNWRIKDKAKEGSVVLLPSDAVLVEPQGKKNEPKN